MDFSTVKAKADDLFSEAHFLHAISNQEEYEQALALMDELIEDYDTYLPLIEMLSATIGKWENQDKVFAAFNAAVSEMDDGVSVLRTLMDQHQLKAEDLKAEIGSKSLVSMILNGSRNLTLKHIQALCLRFNLPPSVFFPKL